MNLDMRLWAKIASTIGILILIDQTIAILINYEVVAITSPYYWLYLAYKTIPLLLLIIPLLYFGFKNTPKS